MLVNQILSMKASGEIFTVAPGASVADAAKLLSEKRIGAIVVSEDGKVPLGILSERDIVRELGRRGADVLGLPITELMTHKLATCTTGEDALVILDRMTQGRFPPPAGGGRGGRDGGADLDRRCGLGPAQGACGRERGPDRHDHGQLSRRLPARPANRRMGAWPCIPWRNPV